MDAAQPATLFIANETTARSFDAVVMCAGVASAELLRPLGLKIPLAAVHGYSISAPIREPLNAPRSALMDERYKVAISRLGNRVRVAGSAELAVALAPSGPPPSRPFTRCCTIRAPGAAQISGTGAGVQEWQAPARCSRTARRCWARVAFPGSG